MPPVPCAFTCELLGASIADATGFRSVVVITFASHAKGPRFETGRKHDLFENKANLIHTTFNTMVRCHVIIMVLPSYYNIFAKSILISIVDSNPACHAGDRGSIPRRGALSLLSCVVQNIADRENPFSCRDCGN